MRAVRGRAQPIFILQKNGLFRGGGAVYDGRAMKKWIFSGILLAAVLFGAASAFWSGRGGVAALLGGASSEASGPVAEDALGRRVAYKEHPRRVYVAGKASFAIQEAAMLFPTVRKNVSLLGRAGTPQREGGEAVQAVLREAWAAGGGEVALPLYTEGSAEDIAAAAPDLVLLKTSSRLFGESLEPLGVPVAYLGLETAADYRRDLALLGTLLGAEDEAAAIWAWYEAQLEAVATAARRARESGAAAPRVLVCEVAEGRGTEVCRVPPPDWIQTWMAEAAGGIPVWTNGLVPGQWATVTLEQVAAWDPDALVVIGYGQGADRAVEALGRSEAWTALRCWRNGRVYAMPGDMYSWDLPTPRWILGLTWLATRLLPAEAAEGLSVADAATGFYGLMGVPAESVRERLVPLIGEAL